MSSSSNNSNVVWPPGFRFYPTEDELLEFYLKNKLESKREEEMQLLVPLVYVYHYDPWDLPGISCMQSNGDEKEWFFFCPSEEKGGRVTRTTPSGYWKATGSPNIIFSSNSSMTNTSSRVLGVRRTMVFYQGKLNHATKTKWKMNEYKLAVHQLPITTNTLMSQDIKVHDEVSICRIHTKSGYIRSFDRRPIPLRHPPSPPPLPTEQSLPVLTQQPISSSNDNHVDMSMVSHDHHVHEKSFIHDLDDEDDDELIKLFVNSNNEWDL